MIGSWFLMFMEWDLMQMAVFFRQNHISAVQVTCSECQIIKKVNGAILLMVCIGSLLIKILNFLNQTQDYLL